MAQLLVSNLDEDVKARLQSLAAEHGRSLEEEARAILRQAVADKPLVPGLGTRMTARFAKSGFRDDEQLPGFGGETLRPVQFD
jgi:plasmid stability protein